MHVLCQCQCPFWDGATATWSACYACHASSVSYLAPSSIVSHRGGGGGMTPLPMLREESPPVIKLMGQPPTCICWPQQCLIADQRIASQRIAWSSHRPSVCGRISCCATRYTTCTAWARRPCCAFTSPDASRSLGTSCSATGNQYTATLGGVISSVYFQLGKASNCTPLPTTLLGKSPSILWHNRLTFRVKRQVSDIIHTQRCTHYCGPHGGAHIPPPK